MEDFGRPTDKELILTRPVWTGTITVGLLSISTSLHALTEEAAGIKFHQVDSVSQERIKQKRVISDGSEVPYHQIVKGYDLGDGNLITFTEAELHTLEPASDKVINVTQFCTPDEIDPSYYDKSYVVLPNNGSARAYSVLNQAMVDTQTFGVGHVVMRSREHPCLIRPVRDTIVIDLLHHGAEVRELTSFDVAPTQPTPTELALACQLVESMIDDFDPSQEIDTYTEKIKMRIKAKAEHVTPVVEAPPMPVTDLMSALQTSLAAIKQGSSQGDCYGSRYSDRPQAGSQALHYPGQGGE